MLQLETFGHHFVIYIFKFGFYFFCLVYQAYLDVFDDQLNRWMKGQIYQSYYPQGFRFTIKYGEKYYFMENNMNSLITQIRDAKRQNYILTRFYPLLGSSKYNIQIYTDDLPDPIYILALSAFNSNIIQRRFTFTTQTNFTNSLPFL